MRISRILAGLLALVVTTLVAGCDSDGSEQRPDKHLPRAGTLLDAAAGSISDISSAHVALRTSGDVPGLRVRALNADLTRTGDTVDAKGSGKMRAMGQLVTMDFVLTGGSLYVKGPTGGFQKIPAALSSSLYDPSVLLDPERGISKVLRRVRGAKTVGTADVKGTPTYKVTGSVPEKVLGGLLPGVSSKADVTFWLARADQHRPVRAVVHLPDKDGNGGKPAEVTVTLSDVNKPVTVTPPA